jgi:diacylglycerol O-acyltransferase
MDHLSALDAEFVEAEEEDRHVSMAIASIAVFEGPVPTYDEFVTAISERLPLVPRYRQKLRTLPFRMGAPVWVDDPGFDIHYHIRQTGLPEPGGDAEIARLMARVMAQRLDRDRPLWEDWLVTGLADNRWALISKVHHCMVDGVSGTDVYRVMFDTPPEDALVPTPQPSREPSTVELMYRAMGEALLLPVRTSQAILGMFTHPKNTLTVATSTARAVRKLATTPLATPSSLHGPIGQQRHYTWARVPLDDVRTIKHVLGGTVNDAVLAAITAGFRSLLLSRHETPHPHTVPSLVPVSLRAPGEENLYDNRVSAMIVHLPVHLEDPVEQLATIRYQLADLKAAGEWAAGQAAVWLASYLPYPIASLSRLGYRIPQRDIVTVTTNVPGPRQTLQCLGRPLVEILPYVPLASTIRVGVAIFSYRDQMTFGITGDYDTTPDLDVLTQGIETGVAGLLKAARASLRASKDRSRPARPGRGRKHSPPESLTSAPLHLSG